jgi:ribA/ribD-fused uncharacterized protein
MGMKKKSEVVSFTKVALEYGWLGNMFRSPISEGGEIWLTSEALFQSKRFDDPMIKELIRNEKSPMRAKMKAKKNQDQMIIVPRSEEDVELMRKVVKMKFDQNPVLKSKLKELKGRVIVEDIGNRKGDRHLFWGAKLVNDEWVGENRMGTILMDLRDEYLD